MQAVSGLKAEARGAHSVHLSWHHPASTLRIRFRVFRKRQAAPDFVLVPADNDGETELTVSALKPWTTYEFYVQTVCLGDRLAASTVSKGSAFPRSDTITATTLEAVPADPPQNFVLKRIEHDSFSVEWQHPAQPNGRILGYRLYYDAEPSREYRVVELPADTLGYCAQHLQPATAYRVQVLSFNAVGEGPLSEILNLTTRQAAAARFRAIVAGEARTPSDDWIEEGSDVSPVRSRSAVSEPPELRPGLESPADHDKSASPTSKAVTRRSSLSLVVPAARPATTAITEEVSQSKKRRDPAPLRPTMRTLSLHDWNFGHQRDFQMPAKNHSANQLLPPGPSHERAQAMAAAAQKRERTLQTLRTSSSAPKMKLRTTPTPPPQMLTEESSSAAAPASSPVQFSSNHSPGRSRPNSLLGQPLLQSTTARPAVPRYVCSIRNKDGAVAKSVKFIHELAVIRSQEDLAAAAQMEQERSMVVVFVTTTTGVRETHHRCQEILALFYKLRVRCKARNIGMDKATAAELQRRAPGATVPQAFVRSVRLGGYDEVMALNESGELASRLKGLEEGALEDCRTCGGAGFVLCTWCQGSKRSLRHNFAEDTKAASLKCTVCNELALQRCPDC